MTNEEKAIIIANLNEQLHDGRDDWSYDECFRSALEMAEWKDAQLKEYLEKKKNLIPTSEMELYDKVVCTEFIEGIINELLNDK